MGACRMTELYFYDENQISSAPDGMYVCYIDNEFINNLADKKLLMIFDGVVHYRAQGGKYRGNVYGAFGPLPKMELAE